MNPAGTPEALAAEPQPGPPGGTLLFSTMMTATYLVIGAIGILYHEMWRDEVQAWMIARDSASLIDLIRNMRLERHPALWHITLWILTRATQSLRAFQLYHLALASASVFLLCRYASFSKFQKALLTFGYFSLFEYGIISRNYALGALLVYAFCAAFPARRYLHLAIILFLLTQASFHGLIIACGLVVVLVVDSVTAGRRQPLKLLTPVNIALSAIAVGAVLTIIQMHSAKAALRKILHKGLDMDRFFDVAGSIWRSHVPIQDLSSQPLWGSNFLPPLLRRFSMGEDLTRLVVAALSVILVIAAIRTLRQRPLALFFYSATSTVLLLFAYLIFQGAIRHEGHLFLVLVAALWLAPYLGVPRAIATSAEHAPPVRQPPRWFVIVLCAQAVAGLLAWQMDIRLPFSQAQAAAGFIRKESLDALPMFGNRAPPASSLQPYLDKPIIYLADGRRGGFIIWGKETESKNLDPKRLWSNLLRETINMPEGRVLLIVNYPIETAPERYRLREIARFTGSLVGDEDYFLYTVERNSF